MIRNNKQKKQKSQAHKLHTYNYRNAIFQGQIDSNNGNRQGKGLIYVTDSNRLMSCNSFVNNKINGHSFFFRGHAQYMYGMWFNHKPHGMAIFRMNQVLIITQYKQGQLPEGSRILYVFQRYNVGVVIQVGYQGQTVVEKRNIYCNQHLQDLVKTCQFASENIPFLLIKYLNDFMVADSKAYVKMRLLNNMYYRYGCDDGIAVIFDEQYRIVSIGVHKKSSLVSFGAKFHGQEKGNTVQQGIFDGQNTFIFEEFKRPLYKIGKMYTRKHLSEVNFRNEIFKDPSEPYFQYHFSLLESEFIKCTFRNLVLEHPDDTLRHIMETEPKPEERIASTRRDFPQFQLATFKRYNQSPPRKQGHIRKVSKRQESLKDIEKISAPSQRKNIQNSEVNQILHENTHRSSDAIQFERLEQKNRLQLIKKQMYTNLSHKSHNQDELKTIPRKTGIINMSPVSVKNVQKQQQKILSSRKRDVYIYEIPKSWKEPNNKNNNLEKHLDVKLNDRTDEIQSKSMMSRSKRKKIFEDNSNLRRDYSPDATASPSPFKSKIRSRIFEKTPERSSRSRSSKIFAKSKTPERRQIQKTIEVKINNHEPYPSPLRQFEASGLRSESESGIKTYPITLSKRNEKKVQAQEQSPYIQPEKSKIEDEYILVKNEQQKTVKEEKRGQKQKYTERDEPPLMKREKARSQIKEKPTKRDEDDDNPKKSNMVYRNNMKKQYNDYLFEPITIKQANNSPYVLHNHLEYNQSMQNLGRNTSKKSIASSNPMKRDKIRSYMGHPPQDFDEFEKMSEFKRKVNYF